MSNINISTRVEIGEGEFADLTIPDCDKKTITEIARFIQENTEKAKNNKNAFDALKKTIAG